MMQLAVRDTDYATVGLSTHGLFIDIYHAIQRLYPPQAEVFFVTGRDAAERILTWEYDDTTAALHQMFTAFQLIVCDRDGAFHLPDDPRLSAYQHRLHRCALPTHYNDISSTAVRQRCQKRLPLDDLVPAAVARYIQEHGLYTEVE
jgi:nicotinic acid mononucleotide adenylyltransferase